MSMVWNSLCCLLTAMNAFLACDGEDFDVVAEPDPQPAVELRKYEFDLATGLAAADFDRRSRSQARRSDAVEDRRGSGATHAQRLQLHDVLFHGHAIAAGPARNDELADSRGAGLRACAQGEFEGEDLFGHGHSILAPDTVTSFF